MSSTVRTRIPGRSKIRRNDIEESICMVVRRWRTSVVNNTEVRWTCGIRRHPRAKDRRSSRSKAPQCCHHRRHTNPTRSRPMTLTSFLPRLLNESPLLRPDLLDRLQHCLVGRIRTLHDRNRRIHNLALRPLPPRRHSHSTQRTIPRPKKNAKKANRVRCLGRYVPRIDLCNNYNAGRLPNRFYQHRPTMHQSRARTRAEILVCRSRTSSHPTLAYMLSEDFLLAVARRWTSTDRVPRSHCRRSRFSATDFRIPVGKRGRRIRPPLGRRTETCRHVRFG